jgi:hypothetical protein
LAFGGCVPLLGDKAPLVLSDFDSTLPNRSRLDHSI